MTSPTEKELLVLAQADAYEVSILVPKRRGQGFLKTPFGHHHGPLSLIEGEIGFDIYGLDGSLDIQTGYLQSDAIPALLERIMAPICDHYGLGYRKIEADEYWAKHPFSSRPSHTL